MTGKYPSILIVKIWYQNITNVLSCEKNILNDIIFTLHRFSPVFKGVCAFIHLHFFEYNHKNISKKSRENLCFDGYIGLWSHEI